MRISDWSSDVCSSDLEPMFAVVKTGGKQYKVAAGDVIKVEKLVAEAGATVELDQVLMVGDEGSVTVGAPTVAGRSEEHTSELQSLMRISYAVFCLIKKIKDQILCTQQNDRLPMPTH